MTYETKTFTNEPEKAESPPIYDRLKELEAAKYAQAKAIEDLHKQVAQILRLLGQDR